jgi:hypothetical protein
MQKLLPPDNDLEDITMSINKEKDFGTPASTSDNLVTLEIDGFQVTAPAGTSVMRAAASIGIEIPKLCATDSIEPSVPVGFAWCK